MLSSTLKVPLARQNLSGPSEHRPRLRAAGALRGVLMLGVITLSAFTAGRIFLAGVVFGGARDLVTLYGATAALALSLALLVELKGEHLTGSASRPSGMLGGRGATHRTSGVFSLGSRQESWKALVSKTVAFVRGRS